MRKKDFISCRTVLWWMVASGCAINCMLRVQLNLVMVAIVVPPPEIVMVAQCNSMTQGNKLSTNNSLILPNDYQNNTNEYQEVIN
ncbi:hypothetical protein PV326_002308 [Microctonus aethiopoides]|nr:hypothetical protein PV326_002308 [Microctonus aethiopoides]